MSASGPTYALQTQIAAAPAAPVITFLHVFEVAALSVAPMTNAHWVEELRRARDREPARSRPIRSAT